MVLWSLAQDVRFALRQIRRAPAFATSAMLTLALGVGANTGIFSLLYALLLRPLPVPNPGGLVQVEITVAGTKTTCGSVFMPAASRARRRRRTA